jgi:hypothetical protein
LSGFMKFNCSLQHEHIRKLLICKDSYLVEGLAFGMLQMPRESYFSWLVNILQDWAGKM